MANLHMAFSEQQHCCDLPLKKDNPVSWLSAAIELGLA
jgi:hypothetical protein